MSPRTAFLGKLIGFYCILISLGMFAHKQAFVDTVIALMHDALALLLTALVVVVAGLAIVLGHNVWSGGALPVTVTLIGWVALLKGLVLLFLPPEGAARIFLEGFHYQQLFYVYAAFSLVLGIYLAYAGSRYHRPFKS
jgi:hypothetical protein